MAEEELNRNQNIYCRNSSIRSIMNINMIIILHDYSCLQTCISFNLICEFFLKSTVFLLSRYYQLHWKAKEITFLCLQVLASLKHKIDQFLSKHNNVDLLVEQARLFLVSRENKLVNARKSVIEAAAQSSSIKRHSLTGESFSRGIVYFVNIFRN